MEDEDASEALENVDAADVLEDVDLVDPSWLPEIGLGQLSKEGRKGELDERPRSPNKRTRAETEN